MASHAFIVTGAAGGIGNEIVAHLLCDESVSVVATDVVEGPLKAQKEKYGDRLQVVIGDIVNQCVDTAIASFQNVTGVALVAGVFGPCYRLAEAPVDKWQQAFNINTLSHLNTLRYAIPELRKTRGSVVAATSGAGSGALFAGWGFYGMSKAAVAFLINQLHLEEKEITALGISPGLCDTKMIDSLRTGKLEGWTAEDVKSYEDFVSKVPMVTPQVAGNAYASFLLGPVEALSGLVVDYDDHRLPIDESLKRRGADVNMDYSKFSEQAVRS